MHRKLLTMKSEFVPLFVTGPCHSLAVPLMYRKRLTITRVDDLWATRFAIQVKEIAAGFRDIDGSSLVAVCLFS
jgi:hypothetical protein